MRASPRCSPAVFLVLGWLVQIDAGLHEVRGSRGLPLSFAVSGWRQDVEQARASLLRQLLLALPRMLVQQWPDRGLGRQLLGSGAADPLDDRARLGADFVVGLHDGVGAMDLLVTHLRLGLGAYEQVGGQ